MRAGPAIAARRLGGRRLLDSWDDSSEDLEMLSRVFCWAQALYSPSVARSCCRTSSPCKRTANRA
jgi:hypothetical protein